MIESLKVVNLTELIGKTYCRVEAIKSYKGGEIDELHFHDLLVPFGGKIYRFYHEQDCSELVYIEDICGDLSDLEDSPILLAEEISHSSVGDNTIWTFYKFSTIKGTVVIRFVGELMSYYSTEVSYGYM